MFSGTERHKLYEISKLAHCWGVILPTIIPSMEIFEKLGYNHNIWRILNKKTIFSEKCLMNVPKQTKISKGTNTNIRKMLGPSRQIQDQS